MNELSLFRRQFPYRFYNATIGILVINVAVFLATMLFPRLFMDLALTPIRVIKMRAFWQVFTYMFLHRSFWHIFINMFVLILFGTQLEKQMGSSEFILYYAVTGLGAGLFTLIVHWYTGLYLVPVGGASGAIYALLLAFATLFPNSTIFVMGILPLRAPIAVIVFAAISLFSHITGTNEGVAHLTHLAGIGIGYLYFVVRLGVNPVRVFFRRHLS